MCRYRWIVFDADGTLFDFEHAEQSALVRTFGEYGLYFDDSIRDQFVEINRSLWAEFEQGRLTSQQLRVKRFEDLAACAALEYCASDFSADYLHNLGSVGKLLRGAGELVEGLAQDFGLVLATNGIADVQHRRFAASGIQHHFRGLVISDEVAVAKPDPAFFTHVFDAMDHPEKAEVLMVGDSLSSDIAGGVGYGIDTCWFNPAGLSPSPTVTPTYEIQSLDEILPIVSAGRRLRTGG